MSLPAGRPVALLLALASPFAPLAAQQAAPPAAAGAPTPAPKLSGYLQARTVYQKDVGLTSSINRGRLTVSGLLGSAFSWRLQGEFRTGAVGTGKASVSLQDALIRYSYRGLGIQAGQFKTPFTREFVTPLPDVESADRSTVVDSLAPKRDIGLQADYAFAKRATITVALVNGEGQNVTANRDSSLLGAARGVVRPLPELAVGADVARYFGDSTRYGADASYEGRQLTVRVEYLRQHRDGVGGSEDRGWYTLGAVSPRPWLQVLGKYEEFSRPAISTQQLNRAWTAGANFFPKAVPVRLTLEYISRKIGSPGTRTGSVLAQLQARF